MLVFLPILALAAPAPRLWDAASTVDGDPVLLVSTPGVGVDGHLPLARALVDAGRDVHVLELPCGGDAEALAAQLAQAAAPLGEVEVVAHGLGATLALMAHDRLQVERYVLLAPVLDAAPQGVLSWLAEQPLGASLDLAAPLAWRERDVASLLLGDDAPLQCVSADLARDVQGWLRASEVPLPLEEVTVPVFVAVSLGDDIATVEAVVPASRRLPDRELVRLGIARLDPQDFSHGEMLWHPVPVHVAVAELTR